MNYFTLEGMTDNSAEAVLAMVKAQFSIEALEVFGTEGTIGYDYKDLSSDEFIKSNINKLNLGIENIQITRSSGSIIINFSIKERQLELII